MRTGRSAAPIVLRIKAPTATHAWDSTWERRFPIFGPFTVVLPTALHTYFAERGYYAATRMNTSEQISAVLIEIGNKNCMWMVKQVYAATDLLDYNLTSGLPAMHTCTQRPASCTTHQTPTQQPQIVSTNLIVQRS